MIIGYDDETSHVYEGSSSPRFAVWPPPLLSLAKLVERADDARAMPTSLHGNPFVWVFREDRFDPVTRVRRGRLYQPFGNAQPGNYLTAGHPLVENPVSGAGGGGRNRRLYAYMPCQDLLNRSDKGYGALLLIGQGEAVTVWRVIQVERSVTSDVVVTLKSKSAFGVVPEVEWASLPDAARGPVRQAIERVLDSAFRETPVSVIDQCRNAATVVLSQWLLGAGKPEHLHKDLAAVAKAMASLPDAKECASWVAQTLARLHARGKSNEQLSKGLRTPTEEDAELALHGLGFLLREVGWAAP